MSSTAKDNTHTDQHNSSGSGEVKSSEKVLTSCEQKYVDNITEGEGIDSMSLLNAISKCASCGK